jgi:autotransporter passenger strand-loop-strand repeat protein
MYGRQFFAHFGVQLEHERSNRLIQIGEEFKMTTISGYFSSEYISSGQIDYNDIVEDGANQYIQYGGIVNSDAVSGAIITVSLGGITSNNTVEGYIFPYNTYEDAWELVSGGLTVGTMVSSGGYLELFGAAASGRSYSGSATSTVVFSSGQEVAISGGLAIGTTVSSGGIATLIAGGSANTTIIESGGVQVVSSGGGASATEINSGGIQNVLVSGSVTGTQINSGGSQTVSWSEQRAARSCLSVVVQ